MTRSPVLLVVGARPNYMKAAPVLEALRARGVCTEVVHTGQHYDPELSSLLLDELGMGEPDHRLEARKGSALAQIAAILVGLEALCLERRPRLLVVFGDVSSTLAGALVANKLGVPLAHIEAGLRSGDDAMPEEWNRRATDLFADHYFCTEGAAVDALLREGRPAERIHLVGNGMIDTLLRLLPRARARRGAARVGVDGGRFALLTLHRPSNVDDPEGLRALVAGAIAPLSRAVPIVFPVHPRTRGALSALGPALPERLVLTGPLGYLDFVSLMDEAALVLTDSGGVQEETSVLGAPCLTLRENTERPVTIERGTNRLVGTEPAAILDAALAALDAPRPGPRVPPLWDGKAGERTAAIIERFLGE
ncbi:MAG: non-hydrolyzing UDP-N-acetylglucosamine 2-epimerase [Planctomycetota bacterium]